MTTVTTTAQGTVAIVQPYLFEPSDSDSDQETETRAFGNFSVRPVTEWQVPECLIIHITPV